MDSLWYGKLWRFYSYLSFTASYDDVTYKYQSAHPWPKYYVMGSHKAFSVGNSHYKTISPSPPPACIHALKHKSWGIFTSHQRGIKHLIKYRADSSWLSCRPSKPISGLKKSYGTSYHLLVALISATLKVLWFILPVRIWSYFINCILFYFI